MLVMQYEGKYKNFIQLKTAFSFLLPIMFDEIDKMMNERDEIIRQVNWKYEMSQIIQKLNLIKKLSYLDVTNAVQFNQQKNEQEW